MAYTNVAGNILTGLHGLLVGEFGGAVPVLWTVAADVSRAAEWIEVRLISSEPADVLTAYAEARRYQFELLYLRKQVRGEDDFVSQRRRLEVAQRLQRLLVDSSHYSDGSTYIWHDGQVGAIEYAFIPDGREDDGLMGVRMDWACTCTEATA